MNELFREYNDCELLEEFEKLQRYKDNKSITLKRCNVGYKCSNAFFQEERFNCRTCNLSSSIDYWFRNKDYVIKSSIKYNKDIFGTVQFLNHTPSQYPPNIACFVYTLFKTKSVFDPFAGWGDRCVAAMACDVNYIGIDCNKGLKTCYKDMIAFYKPYCNSRVKFINKNVQDVPIETLDFDLVFTSPPFWGDSGMLVENYSNMKVNKYKEFMDTIFIPLILICRSIAKWSCFYIPENMEKYLRRAGLKYNKVLSYSTMGNKKYQQYNIYCFKHQHRSIPNILQDNPSRVCVMFS